MISEEEFLNYFACHGISPNTFRNIFQIICVSIEAGDNLLIARFSIANSHYSNYRKYIDAEIIFYIKPHKRDNYLQVSFYSACKNRDVSLARVTAEWDLFLTIDDMIEDLILNHPDLINKDPVCPPKKQIIIVDLDGTLCNCDHRRHFVDGTHEKQDWRSFYESMRTDTINDWCRQLVHKFAPIFVSGRPAEYRELTLDWLAENGIVVDDEKQLFMRKTGDYRDDAVIKKEIYKEHIEPFYEVLFVIDDRAKVAAMWRRLGLICLHCAEGEF